MEAKANNMDVVSNEIEMEEKDVISSKTKGKNINVGLVETDAGDIEVVLDEKTAKGKENIRIDIETMDTTTKGKDKITRNKELCKAIVEERWWDVESILSKDKVAAIEAINSDGNTVLHIVVGIGLNYFIGYILSLIEDVDLPKLINSDGSTALHIAASVGNTYAVELLIKKNKSLLQILDHKNETPLDKAYENMHLATIEYLLKATSDDTKTQSVDPGIEIGINLLVNAISAKQYDLATKLVKKFPQFAVKNDNVLMAIARTFPGGLDYGETLFYPYLDDFSKRIVKRTRQSFHVFLDYYKIIMEHISDITSYEVMLVDIMGLVFFVLVDPILMILWIYHLICLIILMVYFPLFMSYFLLWKLAARVVPPIKRIEEKKKESEEAIKVLKLVCKEIDNLEFPADTNPHYYTRPILEAARQNAYEVVTEILLRSPEAIRYKDKDGYDIIQLAVIHRSEKIYNLIYIIGERKSVYRTIEDSSKNNMLHLTGKLAPSYKLNRRTGAALQLQIELQWREEVKKLVFPTFITKENIFMETPDVVFTKEHENLVKEGEKWMKTVAESCSITAALITTIVFAAAITVPGGNNQATGLPLFKDDIAFTIFAVSDAISLFTSSTALLMFLSILTARFSEQDFLLSLPRRLIIALCTLLVSTTAMMVAFSSTLFLVFCHRKPWMLAPICLLAFLPIASLGTLQIPLIVDLFRSTYVHTFGNKRNSSKNRFNPNEIRLFFGK